MKGPPIDERKFTDAEVRQILKQAAERQPSRALARQEGLSLAELQAIGEEVGIDPSRMEDAARAVAAGGGGAPNRILGGTRITHVERTVEGELGPEQTPEVLSRIRRVMGMQGEVSEIHGSLEWRASGDMGERYVIVTPRDGTTTISASVNLTNAAVLSYLPVGILGSMATVIGALEYANDGHVWALVMAFTAIPVLYVVMRTVFGGLSRSQASRIREAVDELARLPRAPSEG